MRKILIWPVLIMLIAVFATTAVYAQNSAPQTSLSVGPAIVEAVLDKGIPLQKEIQLTNLSSFPQPIKTLKESFTPKEKLDLNADDLKMYDASSWITISAADTDFILQPHETKKITLSILQPDNASPGGHYATVIFQPLIPQEVVSQESVYVYTRVAVLMFLETKGDIVENLEISSVSNKSLFESGPLSFDILLKNTGNTHLAPNGKINIYNDLTNQLVTSVDMTSSIILPKTEKNYHVDVPFSLTAGKFSAEAEIDYGTESQVVRSSRSSFIVFPYTLALFIALPILFILLPAIRYRKRLKKAYRVLFFDRESPAKAPVTSPKSLRTKIHFSVDEKKRQYRRKIRSTQ